MPYVSDLLTAAAASVTGTPTPTRSWQWRRGSTLISGATNSTYTVTEADIGSTLTVQQIERNVAGVATATSAATAAVQAFDPIALFGAGEEGAWYDPSDLTTLYQDSIGTTPAGVGDPVGLMLDKSKGGVSATELLTNGTFDTDTDWTKFNATISGGQATMTVGYVQQGGLGLVVGRKYKMTWDVVSTTSSTMRVYCGTTASVAGSIIDITTGAGSYSAILTAGTVGDFVRFSGGNGTTVYDNISVRELPGNHATQSTSTARPTLQVTGTTPATLGSELSSYTGGVFNGSATGATLIATATAGVAYRVSYEVLSGTATTVLITPTGGSSVSAPASVGTHEVVVYGAGGSLRFGYTNAVNLSVGPVSVKEILTWADPKYYLDFDGVDDWMGPVSFSTALTPYVTNVAARWSGTGSQATNEYLVDGGGVGRLAIYWTSTNGTLMAYTGPNINAGSYTAGNDIVISMEAIGAGSKFRRDGQTVATYTSTQSLDDLYIAKYFGNSGPGQYSLEGRIYGYVGVNRTLTTAEIEAIETYLADKSGVTLP